MNDNKNDAWDNLHMFYKTQDWINKPNVFAEEIVKYIKQGAKILELGAGQGQDTRFFASKGFDVTSTDISDDALNLNKSKLPQEFSSRVVIQRLDMTTKLPFSDGEFDVVYAHLSFHYFDLATTKSVLKEIYRVLKQNGLFIMLNNSTSDPEYNTGKQIEQDYFVIEDKNKRFFSKESLRELVKDYFDVVLLDDLGETYKDAEKGIHKLIRFIGSKKPSDLFKMAVPFTGAIIEKQTQSGEIELLIQTRWKPSRDPVYSGTFEFPAGVLDKGYENVYETLKREIFDETGLKLKSIKNDSQTKHFSPRNDDESFGFRPFCNVQQLKNGKPWIGFIFICEVEDGIIKPQKSEAKDTKWMPKSEVRDIFVNTPEKLFTLEIPAWEYYFRQA